jgi:hypothetical protein
MPNQPAQMPESHAHIQSARSHEAKPRAPTGQPALVDQPYRSPYEEPTPWSVPSEASKVARLARREAQGDPACLTEHGRVCTE